MDNVTEVVALLRRQAALEQQLMNTPERPRLRQNGRSPPHGGGSWRIRKRSLPSCIRRALRRFPDTISVRDVTAFGGSN